VESKGQVDGISLEAQQTTLQAYVEQHVGVVVGVFQDVASGYGRKASNRKGLLDAISKCRAAGSELLVTKVDRFSRNVSILTDLDLSGLKIVSVAEGIVGKKRLRSLIWSAHGESVESSRRNREALAKRKAAGKPLGNPNIRRDAQRLGTDAVKQRKMAKVHDLSIFIEKRPDIIGLTWQGRVKLLNASGHHNTGNKLGLPSVYWVKGSLRKPFTEALELLEKKRAQTVPFPGGDIAARTQSAGATAGQATTTTSRSGTHTASPVGIESQGALKSPSAPSSTTSAPVTDIATFRPVTSQSPLTATRPNFERRPLTSDEKKWLLNIMHKREMSTKDVMDDLGLAPLNTSVWTSVHHGTRVSPDILERLNHWFAVNARHIKKVA